MLSVNLCYLRSVHASLLPAARQNLLRRRKSSTRCTSCVREDCSNMMAGESASCLPGLPAASSPARKQCRLRKSTACF